MRECIGFWQGALAQVLNPLSVHSVHTSEMRYTSQKGRLKAVGTTVHTAHFEDLQKQAHAYALDYLEQLNAQAASLGINNMHYLGSGFIR